MPLPCRLLLLLSLLSTAPAALHAQKPDSLRQLDPVAIEAYRLKALAAGQRQEPLAPALLDRFASATLGELLAGAGYAFVRAYSPGGLASPALRGSGAAHTAVLWNGFNLQSPLNGQADLTLFPVWLLGEATLLHGGLGAQIGSGALGGAIVLQTPHAPGPGLRIRALAGAESPGNWQSGLSLQLRHGARSAHTSWIRQQAANRFAYEPPGGARTRQTGAAWQQQGFLHSERWQLGRRQHLQLHLWHQDALRQLPPRARQTDRALRLLAAWTWSGTRSEYTLRAARLHESLRYTDSLLALDELSGGVSWLAEAEALHRIGRRHRIHGGIQASRIRAQADGYGSQAFAQGRLAAFASWQAAWERCTGTLSLRQEQAGGRLLPPMPSLGLTAQLRPGLALRAGAGRMYRLPTFNDRYWRPGGNPDLQSETGWSQELGADLSAASGRWAASAALTAFSSRIDRWIVWLPGSGYWSPANARRVWARGIESQAQAQMQAGKTLLLASLRYAFTRSTHQLALRDGDESLGKQLIYTPAHQAALSAALRRGPWALECLHTWTGRRYTTTDHAGSLPGFLLGGAAASYRLQAGRQLLEIQLRTENLWNVRYQVVAGRPMPLRYLGASLRWEWNRT
ncbi:MAG: TonB-dependent receptor [Bacteroidia bacterium]|nr:TonB-dependent receptor [Bacteroidia bacterium]